MQPAVTSLLRLGALTMALAVANAVAQDDDQRSQEDPEDTMDEIVVVGPKPGDQVDLEARYESQLQTMIRKEIKRMRILEEEYEWRKSDSLNVEKPSRIKWGYDPKVELEMRRNTDLTDLPMDNTKPATLFRFQF